MVSEEPREVIVYSLADHTQTGGELIAGYSKACKWNLIDPASGLQEWYDINSVIANLTTGNGAVMRKVAEGYELTIPKQ